MSETFAGREVRTVQPHPGADNEVGRWLWAMEEVRRGLEGEVAGLDRDRLDWRGHSGDDNSIGSLLYHIALIETSWLFEDILMRPYPEDLIALFPHDHRTRDGKLTHVPGVPVSEHLERLRFVRRRFVDLLGPMSRDEWDRVRAPEGVDYAVSPAWVVFHLVEHEAGHLFEIRAINRRWSSRTAG
ncbi:MAG TPA: DinB family protein [Trueperaceae bacterium]|nr:DinB family protein [Trueperaceae bacterium]